MADVNKQLSDFGQLYKYNNAHVPVALQLLQGQHRYLANLDFDPLTGEALPQRMSYWLSQDIQVPEKTNLYDRFTYLIEHCADAVDNILNLPRQTVIRVHEMTPVYLAQRLDSRSVQRLSRKPGNNLREKLASNPHILAATRKMSLDTLENRLLKAFLIRALGLLLDRQEAGIKLTEHQEGLIDSIRKALRQEEFIAIKPWQHMPPNNVLLQDKQYRKVWRSWQLLNRLEDDCQQQQASGLASGFGIFSELLRQLSSIERCLLLDKRWRFDLECLSVNFKSDNAEQQFLIEVMAIDIGASERTDKEKVIPEARVLLSLSSKGDIRIQREDVTGQIQSWQIDFKQINGLVEVKLSSSSKNHNQDQSWQLAMPDMFSKWARWLIIEMLPGRIKLRKIPNSKVETFGSFVSIIFDGAHCKAQEDENNANRIGPLFIDSAGLDCGYSEAIEADEKVFSARELSCVNGKEQDRQLGSFVELLASHVHAYQGLHYLVSDHHSEFETSELRREVNRNFKRATPLPKSIAAVYATLEKKQFKRNDLIMVLNSDLDGVYVTPIHYRWGKTPGEEYLERHPSIKLSEQGERYVLKQALVKSGLPEAIAKRFIELYSYSELVSGKARLVLKDEKNWYQVPTNLKVENIDVSHVLFKESLNIQNKLDKIYFLSVSASVKQQKGMNPLHWLASDPLSGSQRLLQHQYKQPNKIFWKDYLPQLMTRLPVNGIEQDFYFVDNNTAVKPERGVAVDIPIEHSFTLPSDKDEMRFTVYQGTGSNRQVFSLLLSLRQPLEQDCECKLYLSYTYGDEQPYKLCFMPASEENKPFNYLDAEWGEKQVDTTSRVVAIPSFPERLEFERLREYSGKKDTTNIIEWIERNLEQLNDIYHFIMYGKSKKRFNFSYQDIVWIKDKDFGFYNSHPDYDSIFVHKSKFDGVNVINQTHFSGDVFVKNESRISLENISSQGELTSDELYRLTKSWRFPMLVFSDQVRSFSDADIPKDLAERGKQAIRQAEELLELQGINRKLESELMQFLSYCHRLTPLPIVEILLKSVLDKVQLRSNSNLLKYVLGDVSKPWQKQLLLQILEPIDDSGGTRAVTLEILSVAMWRDKSLIHQLTAKQVTDLTDRLNEHLLNEVKWLQQEDKFFKWNSFILRLELLLALIRTRESSDSTISAIFALDSNLSKQMLNTVERITNEKGEALANKLKDPRVVSRVKLTVNKPASYYRTPDLLYALKLYLSGDDGADQIMITELSNSE